MLRTDVADDLRRTFEDDGYLFPDYEGYCFANIPHTVASLLGVETGRTLPDDVLAGVTDEFERVLVVLVDGLGFRQWRRERDHHALLDRLRSTARVTPLTSVYPSETAAAMTTFHTGTLPVEHGVVGWNVYEPTADEEFESLRYRTKDGDEPVVPRAEVADADPLYPTLADAGVSSHHVVPFEDAEPGATTRSYESLDDFPAVVAEAVVDAADPAYCFAYLDHVDAAAHESGTESADYRETVGEVFDALDALVSQLAADGTADETLLVVTADHGHVDTDPERNVNLDRREDLRAALRRRADGAPVKFAGSMRNVHLHLRDERAEEGQRTDGPEAVAAANLRDDLDARVFEKRQILDGEVSGSDRFDGNLFGDAPVSETFRRRLGDVVVTHRDLGVWWGDEEPDELAYVGMHGGLHPDEMLVPFAAVRADELVE